MEPTPSRTDHGQALPAGTRIEEFVIERVLGTGGFGITYLARDTSLDRHVVIKENLPVQFCFRDTNSLTVAPRHTHGDDMENFRWSLENFSRESTMLASLDHPGIVKVLRSFEAFGTAYFVMPFVEGLALDDLAKQRNGKPFSEEELKGLLQRVLEALAYLHDRGIYHRDIKPGNILITNEGIPVLIDFGSARQRLSERSMTVVESAGYTPFEQLQSRGNVGPWSDLYALAATIVKIMTGEAPPKANDRIMGDPWQLLAGRSELAERYSHGFLDCLDHALRLLVEERWQTAGEWKVGLEREAATAAKTHKPPPKEFRPTPKPISSESGFWAITVLAVFACWLALRGGEGGKEGDPSILAPAPGGLVINSEPSGADVVGEDGAILGVTPAALKGLPGGQTWSGRLEFKGYQSVPITAEVESGETNPVPPVKLLPTPQKVIVTSDPRGAEVLERGEVLGNTPWESEVLPIDTEVRYLLRHPGYGETEAKGRIPFGKTLELGVEMNVDEFYAKNLEGAELLALAEKGDAYAQALVGNGLFFGPMEGLDEAGISERKEAGKVWIEKSAAQSHPLGLGTKGIVIANEEGEESESKVRNQYKLAIANGLLNKADEGDAVWWDLVGLAYQSGRGVAKDAAEAVNWYRKAADQGYASAQYKLGLCYYHGRGVAKDEVVAVKWYRKAADQGHASAQTNLGLCYRTGTGVAKDERLAVEWYREAAELGHSTAMTNLGVCYGNGTGVAKDERLAVEWYRKAAELGHASAQTYLGFCYQHGRGVAKDERAAVEWYRKAAELGHSTAMTNLGVCYGNGRGVAKDERLAVEWYRKAAELGHSRAMNNLGWCYENGRGVAKDERAAVEWYRKAAELGNDRATSRLKEIE